MKYTFICESCGESIDIWKGINDPAPELHECGGKLKRDYSTIGFVADQGKSDPKSSMYWKKGKTASQIADVLATKQNPY